MKKLKCVLVDDDVMLLEIMQDLCENSPIAEITHCFSNPKDFLRVAPTLDFDLCFLDIYMPEIEGLVVAQLIADKPIIFVTGADNKLKDALELSPIDILTKPIKKERLDKALLKAYSLIYERKEFALFNIAENKARMKLKLSDMFLIRVDGDDPRNKKVTMNDGRVFTLMDYSFEDLMEISPRLEQVNKSELISLDSVESIVHDKVILKALLGKGKITEVNLTVAFKRRFLNRLHRK